MVGFKTTIDFKVLYGHSLDGSLYQCLRMPTIL